MVSIALTAIAGSVLLLGTSASLSTTDDAMQRTIAYGMAQQLMDEIMGARYIPLGGNPYSIALGPGAGQNSGYSRRLYDDIGDFNGYRSQPPRDYFGIALGTDNGQGGQRNSAFQGPSGYFDNWRQEVDVYYVSDANLATRLSAGQTSDYRAVEVRIVYNNPSRGVRELAKLRRIVVYVPPLQVN